LSASKSRSDLMCWQISGPLH